MQNAEVVEDKDIKEVGTTDAPEVDTAEDEKQADVEQQDTADESDTFNRAYVEKLRRENGDYRSRAKTAEARAAELEQRLHAALVAADGRLSDPSDLSFNVEHLDDAAALTAAITDLVSRKPGLKARQYGGDVGAGERGNSKTPTMNLIDVIRGIQQ